jgi:FkbM family methyltransferase
VTTANSMHASSLSKMVKLSMPSDGEPLVLRGSASDMSVIGGIEFTGGSYEPHVIQLLAKVLAPDSICLDIGANIGVIALVMARIARSGRVYAFEPGATNYQYLVENAAANGLDNVVAIKLGLLDRTTDVEFCYVESVAGCSFIPGNDVREGVVEKVHCVSLDEWVVANEIERLDLVKLDAEGAEIAVLQGALNTLNRFRPRLIVEFNPTPMQRFWQRDARDLYELLKSIYANIGIIDVGGSGVVPVDSYASLEELVATGKGWEDLFCTPA